ncbi:MAG: glycosyltransferase family 8 protein [Selenomonadaceae bacterium]|nr:glycosyltransferase family 8 protein [Selenomonadaceae bacterium]
MIHVCYALRDEQGTYSKFVGTSIQSLLENTKENVTVHILYDDTLSEKNRNLLRQLICNFNQDVLFYNVDELVPEKIERCWDIPSLKNDRHGVAIYYRLMIPGLFPPHVSRVIYLDADLIIHLDINEMWTMDLEGHPIAAIPEFSSGQREFTLKRFGPVVDGDVDFRDYFNAGVMIMDLDKIRQEEGDLLDRGVDTILERPHYKLNDQDALNYMYRNNFLKLSSRFNRRIDIERRNGNRSHIERDILHYNQRTAKSEMIDAFNRLWFSYYCRTPFCTSEALLNMTDASQRTIQKEKNLWKRIANLSTIRSRGFFVYPKDAEKIVNLIGKSDGDIGLNAEFPNAIENLVENMESRRGEVMFFIYVPETDYPQIRQTLIRHKFKENIDFFDVNGLYAVYKEGYSHVLNM